MKLPLQFFKKRGIFSYFLVLVLRNNKASAVIFEESGGTVRVINQASEPFADSIESASDEEFLNVLDKTISKAESKLSENVETQKTIFGVKEDWVEDSKIKKDYLAKLKKASDELDLVPIGFLVTTEAITHLLAKEEGAPVSAILAEVDRDYVSVSLIRAGKIVQTKTSKLNGTAPDTVDTLLKHFENVEILPARIIIFNGERDLTQDFISHSWSKTLPFLHLPQILTLEEGFDARAVFSGAAFEMGFQILGDTPLKSTSRQEEVTETSAEKEEIPTDIEVPEKKTIRRDEEGSSEISQDASSDFFGFVKDKDVAQSVTSSVDSQSKLEEIPQELQVEQSESRPLPANAAILLVGAKKILGNAFKIIKNSASKLPLGGGVKTKLSLIGLFAIFVLLLLMYMFGRNATVTLNIDAKKISQTKDVTFSTGAPTDASKNIIAAQFVDVVENGSVTTKATGKKDIGTEAKGTVTMFNNGDGSVTFPKGTVITSSNNLKFTLDKDILVASPSGDASSPQPGTANVSVTANEIGTKYNLPSSTKFTVGTNPLAIYAAKNDNPFAGGTQKSITVVSKEDILKLENDLTRNLEEKAKGNITQQISENMTLLPVFVSKTLSNKNLNKNEGEEASQVTIKADVNYTSIAYSKSDIVSFTKDALKGDIGNLVLNENNITTAVKDIKSAKDKEILASLEISASLSPEIDQEDLAKKISGKSIKDAQNILNGISQVSSVVVKISPNIPLFPKNLPGTSKIKFQLNSNG